MADQNEILSFYDTPRCSAMGISPIPVEDLVIFQDDYDTIRLGDAGELEICLGETTMTDHNPYAPPLPAHQPIKSKSLKERLAIMLNSDESHPFNSRAPSNKPWRPCHLRSPQSSSVPPRNMYPQRGMVHN